MSASLSAYWVKFFKGAGFPQDVATKHAVVFSNNRIKPDMLPDLDKPSLKDMGITLMGDMIAILRYAKKVVEETTCERFLVDSVDSPSPSKTATKPVLKKVTKVPVKTVVTPKPKVLTVTTLSKPKTLVQTKEQPVKKKPLSNVTRVISQPSREKPQPVKRQAEVNDDASSDSGEWEVNYKSLPKLAKMSNDEESGYKVAVPKATITKNQETGVNLKKTVDQKRTVFDRLGDSSVTSTTGLAEPTPVFNITGLGKDIFKKNSSVFNRLGDKDVKKEPTGILKNGIDSSAASHGILKNRIAKNTIVVKNIAKPVGTMRADQEVSRKQLIKTKRKIVFDKSHLDNSKLSNKLTVSSKLASEQIMSIPAKERLGVSKKPSKQVTFKKMTSVTLLKKPGVFSRLGI